MKCIINSVANTAAQEKPATVKSPLLKKARINAVTVPTIAERYDDVEYKIAGTVITVKTAYGM